MADKILLLRDRCRRGGAGSRPSHQRSLAQQRSRERLERILAAASELIAEKGSDQVKMSELAELAGISIGSLYQYFPTRARSSGRWRSVTMPRAANASRKRSPACATLTDCARPMRAWSINITTCFLPSR